jgi:hypothetical protein
MYQKFLLGAVLVLVSNVAQAQNLSVSGGPNGITGTMGLNNGLNGHAFSSTPEEGYLRGLGAYWNGVGNYIHSQGVYENLHEQARRQYLQNEYNRIQGRMALKDQAEARRKANHKDAIQKENERLDMIMRMAELEKRKEEMRKAGLLPPKKEPNTTFVWKDQSFASYAEFKESPAYQELLDERAAREAKFAAEKEEAERRYQEVLELSRKYRKMSSLDWHRIEQRQRAEAILRR